MKTKTKRVRYLSHVELFTDQNTKMAREVNIYRFKTIKVGDDGKEIKE